MEQKAKSVGIWIRVSTEDQAKGESPEHHEKRARGYAEFKEWNVKEVYHLEGVSGKSVMEHPEAQRMLKDIREGNISGLIFSKLARLARNTRELLEFSDIFKEYNADLISLQEAIDTSSPAGRLFYTMIAAMAQWEREEIASRVTASVSIRAKLGKTLGGVASFGYQWVDKKLVVHPEEAPIRRLMFELFLKHKRIKTVARLLNEMGHRTKADMKFTDVAVARLLQDPVVIGQHRRNYSFYQGKERGLKPKEDWVIVNVEPIISQDLWDQCNAIFVDRKRGPKPAKTTVHLFAGCIHCACGGKMYVSNNSPKYVCRECRNKIAIDDMENVYLEQLKNFFLSPTELAQYLESASNTIKEKNELLKTLENEREKIKAEKDKAYRLYMDDQITTQGFGQMNKPLEERMGQLEDELPRLQAEVDFLKIKFQSSDQVFNEAKDLYSRWKDLSHEEKRHIVEGITDKITVDRDTVTIDLCYLPSSCEITGNEQHNVTGDYAPR